jgi:MFS transporter, DHA1 family, multidrug/chloramphenicol efflux transport protein
MTSRWLFFLAAFVTFVFSVYAANDMNMPAMLSVMHDFHGSIQLVPQAMRLFLLGGMAAQLFIGPLADYFGRRVVLLTGASGFVLSSILIAHAQSAMAFLVERWLQGMALAFIPIGYLIVQESQSETQAVITVAWLNTIALIAPMIGPWLGMLCLAIASWRFIFWSVAGVAGVCLIILYGVTPETLTKKTCSSNVWHGYRMCFQNRRLWMGIMASSFAIIPLLVWIATSPVLLMHQRGFTMLQYVRAQWPLFFSIMLGNALASLLVKKKITLNCIINIGYVFFAIAMVCMVRSIPLALSIYGMGLGLSAAPLQRLLFREDERGMAIAWVSFVGFTADVIAMWPFECPNVLNNSVLFGGIIGLYFLTSWISWLVFGYEKK